MTRSKLLLLLLALLGSLSLAGCVVTTGQLGERPAATPVEAVEVYLQRYQPGPTPRLFQTTRLLDRHGRLIAERWEEGRRTWVPLSRISRHLIDATIATEDATFYYNLGVDPARIAGAALQNVQQGQVVSGASTITMQLARNLFLGPDERYDQTMDRKLLEAGLAQELNALFSKDEILEMYLNLLNYGNLAYGPEAAAQTYFGKSAADLTLAEATFLAGIPQQPARLNPFTDFDAVRSRQRVVLDLMVRHGYLTAAQADAIFAEPIVLAAAASTPTDRAPHFTLYVEQELARRLGVDHLRRTGLTITTTLDLDMQDLAQRLVAQHVAELQPRFDLSNAALVALRPGSGEILAMVGSADFYNTAISGQVNVATRPRQPGSAIKPLLYAIAFDDNLISPATVIWDTPITYTVAPGQVYASQVYAPRNYDETFHGPVTARTALANSYNVPAVKLLDAVGVDRMLARSQAMGLRSLSRDPSWYGLSLTLGGGEVTLLELTTAFAALANQGTYVEPVAVLRAVDSLGRPVSELAADPPRQVVSPAAAFLVTDILSDNAARTPAFGANSPLRLSRPAAAKTGTTSDWRDNWTVGYTRYLAAGVWAGNSDGRPMRNTTGLTGAAPIWRDFMEGVLASPGLLATLGAPADPAAWQFQPPADMEQRSDCPPGLFCREGGEYFSRRWLDAVGDAGPLADGVALVPSAPVYVDRGQGPQWAAFCRTEPAALRPLLRLPGRFGPPSAAGPEAGAADGPATTEQLHAVAWSLRHSAPVDLGPCESLGEVVGRALAIDRNSVPLQVFVDWAAAMDPGAGGLTAVAPQPVTEGGPSATGPWRYVLAQPVTHHAQCPGHYIVGQVLNSAGAPVAGVHVVLVDQWGNRADAWSKSGPADYGHYDFPINYFANRYFLTVVDEAGNPISETVTVDHLQGDGGDAPCHTVVWRGG
ncbi:MAG: PBP1A family penicillin-binding protein [Caldilineales bacterium]|nr:PBP1A family penicillin-binding protein [Caldilineales bacterium]